MFGHDAFHWLYSLYFGYVWPSLKGNGPEALVQTVLYAAIAYLFYPPFRAWIRGHVSALHAKLNHIILFHPDIPNEVPGLPDEHQPKQ
jgi:hypothetical protein